MSQPETQQLPSVTILTLISFPRKKKYPECPQCHLTFSKESDLKLHMDSDQWKEYSAKKFGSSFGCEECCLYFETNQGLMQHLGKIHEQRHKYVKCPDCRKKFKNKYAVKFHRKQVHQKATRTNCPCCGKGIYNKYLLPQHILKCEKNALRIRD